MCKFSSKEISEDDVRKVNSSDAVIKLIEDLRRGLDQLPNLDALVLCIGLKTDHNSTVAITSTGGRGSAMMLCTNAIMDSVLQRVNEGKPTEKGRN